jgi:hypothetical protein
MGLRLELGLGLKRFRLALGLGFGDKSLLKGKFGSMMELGKLIVTLLLE